MGSLKSADDEMAPRHRLEMVGKGGIDRRASDRAENRHRLGGELLADGDAESRCDWLISRTTTGAVSPATPCCRIKRALSLTDLASAARTAR